MIRVAYVSHILNAHDRNLIERIAASGLVELHVITAGVTTDFPRSSNLRLHTIHHPAAPLDDPTNPSYRRFAALRLRLSQRYYAHKVRTVISRERCHVLHAGWVQTDGRIAALAGFHPFLLMPWGSDILLRPFERRQTLKLTSQVIRRCDFITCDCEEVRRRVLQIEPTYPKDRFLIFPWGVDLAKFCPSSDHIRAKAPRLIMTRSLEPIYNVRYFLQILAALRPHLEGFSVRIIGEGSLRRTLEAECSSLGLADVVEFLGKLDSDRIAEELKSSDLYISTSLSDGASVSLLEAMACGLPCAVSDIPSNREWVENDIHGALLPLNDVEQATKIVLSLLKSGEGMREMGARCRKQVEERADWHDHIKKLVSLYHELAASGVG